MWRRYLIVLGSCTAAALALIYLAILLLDPFGISPLGLIRNDILPDANRRFVAPQIIRSGRYDSFLVGTSTIDRIEPGSGERVFGGRFANVSLQAGTPYETELMLTLIGRSARPLRNVLIGIDYTWCTRQPARRYHEVIRIPEHLYGENRILTYANLLSFAALRMARQKFAIKFGRAKQRFSPDGQRPQLVPDRSHGPAILAEIYGTKPRPTWIDAKAAAPSSQKIQSGDPPATAFPALAHLATGLNALGG